MTFPDAAGVGFRVKGGQFRERDPACHFDGVCAVVDEGYQLREPITVARDEHRRRSHPFCIVAGGGPECSGTDDYTAVADGGHLRGEVLRIDRCDVQQHVHLPVDGGEQVRVGVSDNVIRARCAHGIDAARAGPSQ
ncbi:hypothetical protein [Arthrobacter sp. SX1312]|uniref:hypothetical protein n=1 Tax=Arthrobacter sp. SX1312 TaxID=2058896 RepID=UPI0015E236BD|nr:hypothetical protein [Arthrobacter sp. SX1312]